MNLLFTYGTMRKGCYNNDRLKNAHYVGEATTAQPFCMVAVKEPRPIPYIFKPSFTDCPFNSRSIHLKNFIVGDVYQVNDADLAFIDTREGAPYYYKRKVIPVYVGKIQLQAYAYIMDKYLLPESYDFVPSGDFSKYYKFGSGYKVKKEILTPNWRQFAHVGVGNVKR